MPEHYAAILPNPFITAATPRKRLTASQRLDAAVAKLESALGSNEPVKPRKRPIPKLEFKVVKSRKRSTRR